MQLFIEARHSIGLTNVFMPGVELEEGHSVLECKTRGTYISSGLRF